MMHWIVTLALTFGNVLVLPLSCISRVLTRQGSKCSVSRIAVDRLLNSAATITL
jgi:hypothetical protein